MTKKLIIFLMLSLSFSSVQANAEQTTDEKEIKNLYSSISKSLDNTGNKLIYRHILKSVSIDGSLVTFENNMSFTINWWYYSIPKNWKEGDQIFISYDFQYHQVKLQHANSQTIAWGKLKNRPSPLLLIKAIPNGQNDPDAYSKISLDNGYIFKGNTDRVFGNNGWKVKDRIIIFANSDDFYQLWNIEKNQIFLCEFVANTNQLIKRSIEIKDILSLEDRLNAKVLQQPEATKALLTSILNYTAGLKEQGQPIGVFLFIGPTGVGKTELAKVLAREIYNDDSSILRFDMSHFTEPHSISRLIGSQPGYINHEEGGQLTNPLLNNSQIIVLLDEIEKAHPQVIKTFLPVFDEGFILDTKNNRISCSETIFIMTSNLCANEIVELYHLGYSPEEILQAIEPYLMNALSPELYNRVEAVLFRPLLKETMDSLVELMLDKVEKRVLLQKQIQIHFDDSLKTFLVENGYHPLLGARPLRKLIEKRVVSSLAYSIIKEGIESNSEILLLYDKDIDCIIVQNFSGSH